MNKKQNKYGGGNQTNINGLNFEKKTSLKKEISKNPDFIIKNDNEVYKGKSLMGYIFEPKGNGKMNKSFYDFLESEFDIDAKKMLSKMIHPDKIFYNVKQKRFYVIECKYQTRQGSVDEKLQTFPFKRSVLNYLLFIHEKSTNVDLEYLYVLNKEFFGEKISKTSKYKYYEVFKYIRENGSNYFFDVIPLNKLGIY